MFSIQKVFTFEAAHKLPFHNGKCARLHGHSYKCTIEIRSESLIDSGSQSGMVMDFGDIKAVMNPLLDEYLDHHYLNETLGLESPTAELIAKWIFDRLKPLLPGLYSVMINETCTCAATYMEES